MTDLTKLRKVLDFLPSQAMNGWADRDDYDALNRRLNREVRVERLPPPAPKRSGKRARDEAILVVPAEEWDAARHAEERVEVQEEELARVRLELVRVRSSEEALEHEVAELRGQLPTLEAAVEKKRTELQLLGVRRSGRAPTESTPGDVPSGAAAQGWEVVDEPVTSAPTFTVVPDADAATALETDRELAAAEAAIQRVEVEIQRIEGELQTLVAQETELKARADEGFTHNGYALYHRTVGHGKSARDFYFFSRDAPATGAPSPVPAGYRVAVHPRSGLPLLKKMRKAKTPKRRSRKK